MTTPKTIAIGCDHAGYEYKEALHSWLQSEGYVVLNFGTDSPESVDYPDYVHPLCTAVENQKADIGILLCGSANGVAIAANRHRGIRAAICWLNEIARVSRLHNDANVICLPARYVSLDLSKSMVREFITTSFEGGRHQRRVEKISQFA
jgi:ribose 5-phosphate isomerase B